MQYLWKKCWKKARRLKIEGLQTGPEEDTDEEVNFKKIKSNQSENADIRDDPPFEKNKNNPTFNQAEKILANVGNNINSENIAEVDEQIEKTLSGNQMAHIHATFVEKMLEKSSAT